MHYKDFIYSSKNVILRNVILAVCPFLFITFLYITNMLQDKNQVLVSILIAVGLILSSVCICFLACNTNAPTINNSYSFYVLKSWLFIFIYLMIFTPLLFVYSKKDLSASKFKKYFYCFLIFILLILFWISCMFFICEAWLCKILIGILWLICFIAVYLFYKNELIKMKQSRIRKEN